MVVTNVLVVNNVKKPVLVVGNIVADFIASPVKKIPRWGELYDIENPISISIGGNGAIFAVCARKLGLKTRLIGKIGNDAIGRLLLDSIKTHGVDISGVQISKAYHSGITLALVDSKGERMFFHHQGSNRDLKRNDIDMKLINDCSALVLCSILIIPGLKQKSVKAILESAKDRDIPTFLDVAWDPTGKWDLGNICSEIDFFIPNEIELKHLGQSGSVERAAEKLLEKGIETIIVKRGAKGCTVFSKDNKPVRINAPLVEVVDTTGAGDAFNAGFVYSYLKTNEVLASAEFAVYTASQSVTGIGGTECAPDSKKVESLIKKAGGNFYK